jgi:serine/threonine protein phosphatase PrpC
VFVRIESGGKSDIGQRRGNNEDSWRVVEPLKLFVISDGMGGEAHGEVASALAVETVAEYCAGEKLNAGDRTGAEGVTELDEALTGKGAGQMASVSRETSAAERASGEREGQARGAARQESVDPAAGGASSKGNAGAVHAEWSEKTKQLFTAAHLANKRIYEAAEMHTEQRGMGATLTAAWIDGEKLSIAHVGDSRAYLLRGGALEQLTKDHSLVAEQVRRGILTAAEAEHSEMQNVLLRALGTQAEIEVDAEEHTLFGNDVLLLCTDGLTRMVTEPEIAGTLQAEPDAGKAAERLVELANSNGGADNITAVVIRMKAEEKGLFSWLRRGSQKNAGSNGSAGGF